MQKLLLIICFSFPLFLFCSCWDGWNLTPDAIQKTVQDLNDLKGKRNEQKDTLTPVICDDTIGVNKDILKWRRK